MPAILASRHASRAQRLHALHRFDDAPLRRRALLAHVSLGKQPHTSAARSVRLEDFTRQAAPLASQSLHSISAIAASRIADVRFPATTQRVK